MNVKNNEKDVLSQYGEKKYQWTKNHYPDFIVKTKKGNILMIETKGDDRDNSDLMNKIQLGELWDKYAGNQYKYFMIFENNALDGAKTVDDFMKLLKDL